jgi:hypothetical protein
MKPDKGDGWQPIAEHDGSNTVYDLAWYYKPSAFAAMNGSVPFWCYAEGFKLYDGVFTGILGGRPTHFRQKSGEFSNGGMDTI